MFDTLAIYGSDLIRPLSTTRGLVTSLASLFGLGLVVAASFMRTMIPLRALTVGSNVMLLGAALLAPNAVAVVLYLVLIPLNTFRLLEIVQLTRRVTQASSADDLSGVWLKPYMKATRLPAGSVLFRKGDRADRLFLLLEGRLGLVEIGKTQPPLELFGEISFFAPDRSRTLTARCATDCLVLSMGEQAFKQLYFQNPKFAFQISHLIAHRLSADIQRLRRKVDALKGELEISGRHDRRSREIAIAGEPEPVPAGGPVAR